MRLVTGFEQIGHNLANHGVDAPSCYLL